MYSNPRQRYMGTQKAQSSLKQLLRYLIDLLSSIFVMIYEISLCKKQRRKKNASICLKFKSQAQIESNENLEGTLVRSNPKPWRDAGPEEIVTVTYESGTKQKFYVRKRPFLKQFLENAQRNFNIILFTAQIKEYADPIIDLLGIPVKQRFYRDSCLYLNYGRYQKELLKITKNLRNCVMIDNSRTSIQGDQENSFLIPSFKGDLDDNVLLTYSKILDVIAQDRNSVNDIQSVIDRVKDEFDLTE